MNYLWCFLCLVAWVVGFNVGRESIIDQLSRPANFETLSYGVRFGTGGVQVIEKSEPERVLVYQLGHFLEWKGEGSQP